MSTAASVERPHRGTIFVEDARILSHEAFAGRQYVLRLAAPLCAANATAGSFAHVAVDPSIPMRRPLSIMRADANAGWIELLYKVMGQDWRIWPHVGPATRSICWVRSARDFNHATPGHAPC
jgi:dihydroorotate dehydrogenase electron transfer subunit